MSKHESAVRPDLPEKAMRKIVEKWSPATLALLASLKALEALTRIGIVPKEDGWRKWTRAYCSGETCKFCLPVFRLDPCSLPLPVEATSRADEPRHLRQRVVHGLASFLRARRGLLGRRLDWRRSGVRVVENSYVDVVEADFDLHGRLAAITPHFESPSPTPEDPGELNHRIVAAYNETRDLGDKRRPVALANLLRAAARRGKQRRERLAYVERVLGSVFVHFDESRREHRFSVPAFGERKHPGCGVFNVLSRLYSGPPEVDLWFQSAHVAVDGVPVMELLNELKAAWGVTGPVAVPAPSSHSRPSAAPLVDRSPREVACLHDFLCFDRLLSARRELNEKHGHLVGKMTLASLIVWGLAQHPALRDVKVMTPVDVLPRPGQREERTLSFVGIRPARFLDPRDRERSFLRFQADFNQQLESARRRENAIHRAMNAQALLPVWVYTCTNALMPRAVDDVCGTVTLTIHKDADFCVAPIDDRNEAVIAVGNAQMPTEDGGTAGAVSVRAVNGKVEQYRDALRDAICDWRI
jgi:hypothetical protein